MTDMKYELNQDRVQHDGLWDFTFQDAPPLANLTYFQMCSYTGIRLRNEGFFH